MPISITQKSLTFKLLSSCLSFCPKIHALSRGHKLDTVLHSVFPQASTKAPLPQAASLLLLVFVVAVTKITGMPNLSIPPSFSHWTQLQLKSLRTANMGAQEGLHLRAVFFQAESSQPHTNRIKRILESFCCHKIDAMETFRVKPPDLRRMTEREGRAGGEYISTQTCRAVS